MVSVDLTLDLWNYLDLICCTQHGLTTHIEALDEYFTNMMLFFRYDVIWCHNEVLNVHNYVYWAIWGNKTHIIHPNAIWWYPDTQMTSYCCNDDIIMTSINTKFTYLRFFSGLFCNQIGEFKIHHEDVITSSWWRHHYIFYMEMTQNDNFRPYFHNINVKWS